LSQPNCPVTNASASISNLTLQFGHNAEVSQVATATAAAWNSIRAAAAPQRFRWTTVTLTDLQHSRRQWRRPRELNFTTPGTGQPTITNSIFRTVLAAEVNVGATGSGGGVFVFDLARMSMSGTQVLNNTVTGVGGE